MVRTAFTPRDVRGQRARSSVFDSNGRRRLDAADAMATAVHGCATQLRKRDAAVAEGAAPRESPLYQVGRGRSLLSAVSTGVWLTWAYVDWNNPVVSGYLRKAGGRNKNGETAARDTGVAPPLRLGRR